MARPGEARRGMAWTGEARAGGTAMGLLAESWRGRLSWHPYTEVLVIAEHGKHLWALDFFGEPYTLRADCVERINP